MTRINCLPVEFIPDRALHAEYRELPRIFTAVLKPEVNLKDLPGNYRMGEGHVRFFYNKIFYLIKRYNDIIEELELRGYMLNQDLYMSVLKSAEDIPKHLMNDWQPSDEDMDINKSRLRERGHFS